MSIFELSKREKQILKYISENEISAKELSEKLFISHSTMKTHLTHIYSKLGVDGLASAIRHYYKNRNGVK